MLPNGLPDRNIDMTRARSSFHFRFHIKHLLIMYKSFAIFYTHIFLFYLEEKYCQMTSMAAGLVNGRNNTSRKRENCPKVKININSMPGTGRYGNRVLE